MNNLYGPNDNFNIKNGHVIPSLIHKFHIAKRNNSYVQILGKKKDKRCFLFSEDAAKAVIKTGRGKPGSTPCVWALKALQNSIIFKPLCPKAGPIGGDGFALPAGTWSLIKPIIFFAILISPHESYAR